jgi:hypothetical protein
MTCNEVVVGSPTPIAPIAPNFRVVALEGRSKTLTGEMGVLGAMGVATLVDPARAARCPAACYQPTRLAPRLGSAPHATAPYFWQIANG